MGQPAEWGTPRPKVRVRIAGLEAWGEEAPFRCFATSLFGWRQELTTKDGVVELQDRAARRARATATRRDLFARLLAGLAGERRATVLLGPRQVGKTTLLLQVADALLDSGIEPDRVVYFDLSDERVSRVVPRDVVDAARQARIRETVRFWNQNRNIKLHTIAVGGSLEVLEWLAQDSGGRHVSFR